MPLTVGLKKKLFGLGQSLTKYIETSPFNLKMTERMSKYSGPDFANTDVRE